MKPDTPQRYGITTRFLHWTMAACYLFMFATAIAWNMDESLKFLTNPHKAVGFLLLILSAWRVMWAIRQSRNRPVGSMAAKFGHWAMYLLMLAVPVTGVMRQITQEGQIHGALAFFVAVLVSGTYRHGRLPLHQRRIRNAPNVRKSLNISHQFKPIKNYPYEYP